MRSSAAAASTREQEDALRAGAPPQPLAAHIIRISMAALHAPLPFPTSTSHSAACYNNRRCCYARTAAGIATSRIKRIAYKTRGDGILNRDSGGGNVDRVAGGSRIATTVAVRAAS